ncbi:MAG: MATE family efflux transporter [Ruminococcaceae bacterium]|nr:MATE family efflux transporter [Oscillospiraceae bacterium]
MMSARNRTDFTSGSMTKSIITYAATMILTVFLQHLFGTADMVVVGKFVGDAAQAAVSSTGMLRSLMITLLVGLSQGVNVLVAQSVGAKDREQADRVAHTAFATALSAGTALGIVCIIITPYALQWMKYPPNIMEQARIYMYICFAGLPIQLIYNCAAAALRAQGDSQRPMYFLTLGGVVNVGLNLIMVLIFGMGVSGVAWATVASNAVAAWLTIRCMNHDGDLFHLALKKLRIHLPTLKEIARIGVPGAITNSAYALSGILIQSSINSLGDVVVTASGAAGNLGTYINSVCSAFGSTCLILAAQNLGANRLDRVKRGQRLCLGISMGCAAVLGLLLIGTGPILLRMFTNDPQVIKEGLVRIRSVAPFYVLNSLMACAQGAQQGLGHAGVCSLITVIGTCGLRLLWVFLVFPMFPTHAVIVFCFPVGWGVTGVVQQIRLHWLLRRMSAEREQIVA